MNRLLALFAFLVLVAFLFILVRGVARIDLIAVVVLTVALTAWDFLTSSGKKAD